MSDYGQDTIQQHTAYYTLTLSVVYGVPNMISSFVLGSLSDSYGRRLFLAIAIFGQGVSYAIFCAVVVFDFSLYSLYFTEFVSGISGSVMPVAAAYLAAVTADSSRTFRSDISSIPD